MENFPVIDLNKLSRNLFLYPLAEKENLCKQDFEYLYIDLNLSSEQICNLFYYPYHKFKDLPKKYGLYKPRNLTLKHREKTCLEIYGSKNVTKSEYFKSLRKEKGKEWSSFQQERMLKKYGYISNFSDSKKMKEYYQKTLGVDNPAKLSSVVEKRKISQKLKFNGKLFFQTEECRKKCNSEEANEKRFKSLKKHKNINISKIEKEIFQLLLKKFPDAIHQYRDKNRYPFNCDFYIPSLDLFIEFQGNWTHGGHPYDEKNPEDFSRIIEYQEKYEKSITSRKIKYYYKNAIYTWTDLDIRKRKIAKENNLNYLEFFNKEEFLIWLNSFNGE